MLKTRVITALVLLVFFLGALFWLPPRAWAVFAGVMVVPAAWEWGQLIKLRRVSCGLYVVLVIAACALVSGFAQTDLPIGHPGLHTASYLVAALFWLVVVPWWL